MSGELVLEATGVDKIYPAPGGVGKVHALIDVNFAVQKGRTIGLVGESGSGKTTLTRMLLNLEEPTSGSVRFEGTELSDMTAEQRRHYRHSVAAVFQNPYSSLDPRMRIWDAVTEQRAIERTGDKASRRARAIEVLEVVGLTAAMADRYPHQLSGGQRQRVAIARALSQEPEVIILDEPLSALDVSVSAQIVNLLLELQEEFGLTYVFVGHDLRLVHHLCHDVSVMYHGRLVEEGKSEQVLQRPRHHYTAALVTASDLESLEDVADDDSAGTVPDVLAGCAYRARCPQADDRCADELPERREVGEGVAIRCHWPIEHADATSDAVATVAN